MRMGIFKKYGFLWVTLAFFVLSIVGHWWLAWRAYEREQKSRGKPVDVGEFAVQTGRDTLENWQSEFLQLIWQVGGLSVLLWVGSTQSRESEERMEAKIDLLLSHVPEGEAARRALDERFCRTDA